MRPYNTLTLPSCRYICLCSRLADRHDRHLLGAALQVSGYQCVVPLLREVRPISVLPSPEVPPCTLCLCKDDQQECPSLQWHICHGTALIMSSACRVTFALEEKNLPYDSVLIELRNKPHWYKDIVPTELTPAAVINGDLVYESLDILKVCTVLLTAEVSRMMFRLTCSPIPYSQCSEIGLQPLTFQRVSTQSMQAVLKCNEEGMCKHLCSSLGAACMLCTAISGMTFQYMLRARSAQRPQV